MKKLKLLVILFAVTMMLVGCSNIQKVEEPTEPVEKTQEVVGKEEVTKEEKVTAEKTKVVDPTKYDYWVVVYDQFKNELVRTTAHYGETVEPYPGQVVTVYTNAYIDVYVEYNVPEPEPTPQPEPEVEQEPDCHHSGRAYWVDYADDTTVKYIMFTYDEVDGWVSDYNVVPLAPKAIYSMGIPWLNVVQTGDVVHVHGNEYTICDQECITLQPEPDIHHKGELYWLGYKDENKIEYVCYQYNADDEAWSQSGSVIEQPTQSASWAADLEVGDIVHIDGDNYILCDQSCVNPQQLPPQ